MVTCIRCDREIERKVKARGKLGKLHDTMEKAGMPAICCECDPSSNWQPVKEELMKIQLRANRYNEETKRDEPGEVIAEAEGLYLIVDNEVTFQIHDVHWPQNSSVKQWIVFHCPLDNLLHAVSTPAPRHESDNAKNGGKR